MRLNTNIMGVVCKNLRDISTQRKWNCLCKREKDRIKLFYKRKPLYMYIIAEMSEDSQFKFKITTIKNHIPSLLQYNNNFKVFALRYEDELCCYILGDAWTDLYEDWWDLEGRTTVPSQKYVSSIVGDEMYLIMRKLCKYRETLMIVDYIKDDDIVISKL
jgi:hypothetical protein